MVFVSFKLEKREKHEPIPKRRRTHGNFFLQFRRRESQLHVFVAYKGLVGCVSFVRVCGRKGGLRRFPGVAHREREDTSSITSNNILGRIGVTDTLCWR